MNRPSTWFFAVVRPRKKTVRAILKHRVLDHEFRVSGPLDRKPDVETRTFGTMTHKLLELADWLTERGCTHVVMECTGVIIFPVL